MNTMEYIFFYGHTKDNGYMSNFSEYTFIESGVDIVKTGIRLKF
jgi:hypothetical protein